MKGIIICDIDGTIAEGSHRMHHIAVKGRKDWDAYFAKMSDDSPILHVTEAVCALSDLYEIVLVSGRPEKYRAVTEAWLEQHGICNHRLYMRPDGDRRADDIVKREILERHIDHSRVKLVIDDRPRVIRMWRSLGLDVFDVGEGIEF